MKHSIQPLLLLLVGFAFSYSKILLAGDFSEAFPLHLMPAKLNGAYVFAQQCACSEIQAQQDGAFFGKNQITEYIDDFDDTIDFMFDEEDQEETEAVSQVERYKEEGKFQTILKWSETLQQYVAVLITILPDRSTPKENSPDSFLHDVERIDLTDLKPSPSPTRVYETSSSEHINHTKDRPTNSMDSSTEAISSSSSDSSSESTSSLPLETPLPSSSVVQKKEVPLHPLKRFEFDRKAHYYTVNHRIFHESSNLTEKGATELQEDNPALFATTNDAIAAYDTLKQYRFKNSIPTEEYQAIARLIVKYLSKSNLSHILFGINAHKDDCFYMEIRPQRFITQSQLVPLQLKDEDTLLVICTTGDVSMQVLTITGAEELHKQYPNLFQSMEEAILVFQDMGIFNPLRRASVGTEQYQAFAKLIKKYKDNIDVVVTSDNPDYLPSVCVKEIPYGMTNHGCFDVIERDYESNPLKHRKIIYETFLDSKKCLLTIKKLLLQSDLSSDEKIKLLTSLYPLDDEDLTLKLFMTNTELLIGTEFDKARKSFEEHASLQNEPGPPKTKHPKLEDSGNTTRP